jgi:uncharacterized protein (TIGR03083 family)
VGVNPEVRRHHDAIREVAALLGEGSATPPPAELRSRLMRAVAGLPGADDVVASDPLDVYAHQVDALKALLDSLVGTDWRAIAAPYAWSVHALVAHLLVIERYTASRFALDPALVYGDREHHLAVGAGEIAAEVERSPRDTVDAWYRRAALNVEELREGAVDLAAGVTFHGWPFSGNAVLIARSFELWTHADDICRATGRALTEPPPQDLRAMSTFSVNSLPLVLPVVAPTTPMAPARVVLTGRGGGTFDLARDRGHARCVTVVVDVVDYCRLAARRIAVEDLAATVDGDRELADGLFAAARVFAV